MPPLLIVGGGMTGLAAAYFLRKERPGLEVTLVEQEPRLGGKIRTEIRPAGFLVEAGPESFVRYKPAGVRLCRDLGLSLIDPVPENRKTYILFKNRFLDLPEGILSILSIPWTRAAATFLKTPLLSLPGKIRLCLEPFVPRAKANEDESIGTLIEKRLGKEFFDNLVEPLLSGVYGSDARHLSARTLLPEFHKALATHGSFFRASLARSRNSRPASKESIFITLKNGLQSLPDALEQSLSGFKILKGVRVQRIRKSDSGYAVETEHQTLEASAVLLTTPAPVSAALLEAINPDLAARLREIPYASSAVFTFGFRKEDVGRALDAYGFIVPRRAGLPLQACTFSSSKWAGRAQEGKVLLRAYRADSRPDLQGEVLSALTKLLNIQGDPLFSTVHLHPDSMPQYRVGHGERLERIRSSLAKHPGLYLAGSAFDGVGIPDCIQSADSAVQRILKDSPFP